MSLRTGLWFRRCSEAQSVHGCRNQSMDVEYHPKSRIITFLISIVSSAALSGEETDTLLGIIPAIVLTPRKQLTFQSQAPPISKVHVILDEGVSRRKGAISTGNDSLATLALSRQDAAAAMKLGVRVVRGPDWKWGDQVCDENFKIINKFSG